MTGGGGATLTYPQTAYCINAANPSPTVTGSAGGTFSSTAGLSINAASGVINLSASTAGTYTVTYVGVGGACPPSATFDITINALPNVVAGSDQTVCAGQQVTLTGAGANSYSWSGGVTNGVPFTPGSTATYTVTGTSAAGCTNTDDVIVNVDPAANPVFAADITSGCAPLTVTFTNQSGGVDCDWVFGDGSTGTGCGSVTHTYNAVGCYDVTLTTESALGCIGTVTLNNYICVTPDPVASFFPVPVEMTTDNPTSTMTNESTNATSYLWTFEDGTTSNLFEPTHTFPASEGNYGIELVAYSASGCTDTARAIVVVKEDVIFYVPNTFTPDGDEHNQGFLPVFTSGFDPYNFNMKIFNRWGEIVFETNNHLVGWDGTYHEQLVQDGTYTWKIEFKISSNDSRRVAVGHISVLR
jgi:gliding motility-associated-like protein